MPVSIISRVPSRTSSVSITQLLCLDSSGAVFDVAIVFVISLKDNSNLHKYGPKLYPHFSPRDLITHFLQKSSFLCGTCPGVGRAGMSGHAHMFQTNLDLSSGLFQLVTSTGQAPDLQRCSLSCHAIITAPTLHQPAAFRGQKFHNLLLLPFPHKA